MIGKILLYIGKNLGEASWWRKKCDLFLKNSWEVWSGGNSATPRKICNFYPHLTLQKVFSTFNLPQNCYIMTIGSPTHHIYAAQNTILTIWQNMKSREFRKSQFPNCLVNWEKL